MKVYWTPSSIGHELAGVGGPVGASLPAESAADTNREAVSPSATIQQRERRRRVTVSWCILFGSTTWRSCSNLPYLFRFNPFGRSVLETRATHTHQRICGPAAWQGRATPGFLTDPSAGNGPSQRLLINSPIRAAARIVRLLATHACVLRSPSTFTCPDLRRSRVMHASSADAFVAGFSWHRCLRWLCVPPRFRRVRFALPRREFKYGQTPEIAMHGFEVEMHPTALLLTSVAFRDIAAKERHPRAFQVLCNYSEIVESESANSLGRP